MRKIGYTELVENAAVSSDTLSGVTFAILALADRVDACRTELDAIEQSARTDGK